MSRTNDEASALLRRLLDAALSAADPAETVPPHLPEPPAGRTIVVGAGKAAAKMARAVEDSWTTDLSGLVVTRYGHGVPCERIEIVEAAHPVPDAAGREAASRMLETLAGLTDEDLVLCLISGGASALLSLPIPGIDFAEKQTISRALLASGARIQEMNAVRKHLSAIKGGRLALAAAPARVVTLIISDVVGDEIDVIGSGPTAPDRSTLADARAVLDKYGIDPPKGFIRLPETPKPGDPAFERVENIIVATARDALLAAADTARAEGFHPLIHGEAVEGEAREMGANHARYVLHRQSHGVTPLPAVMLSGGEATVTIQGEGNGGPNLEFLLAAAIALDGAPGVHALAADTDGTDGASEAAGAVIHPDTLPRARDERLDPADFLARNDSHTFFERLGDLVTTGPTLTNVNDFRAILIEEA